MHYLKYFLGYNYNEYSECFQKQKNVFCISNNFCSGLSQSILQIDLI